MLADKVVGACQHKGSALLLSAVQESECHIHPAQVWLEGLKNRGEGAMS